MLEVDILASKPSRITGCPGNYNNTRAIGDSSRIDDENAESTLLLPTMHVSENILCLPPEVLANIFLEYMWAWHRGHKARYTTDTIPPWISVSHVCRYWRDVALDCAGLWTHLFFVSSKWVDELLRRSKTAPLIIRADTIWIELDLLKKALRHMDRVQDLFITCPSDVVIEIRTILAAPAPLLRSFHLSLVHGYPGDQLGVSEDIFAGVIPDLRQLHLKGCRVDWLSPIFNGLTELNLCRHNGGSKDDLHGLLLTLGQLSSLRRLRLEDLFWKDRDNLNAITNIKSVAKVSLPMLEWLVLFDSTSWVTVLLAHLEFPQSTIVQLNCIYVDTQDLSFLRTCISNRFAPSHPWCPVSPHPLRSLDIQNYDRHRLKVACSTSNLVGNNWFPRVDPRFEFHLAVQAPLDEVVAFFQILPMKNLNTIAMTGDYGSPHTWNKSFGDAPDLRVICQKYSGANGLIHALQPSHGIIFAPTLTDIEFKVIDFNQWSECKGQETHRCDSGCLQCLHHVLASRADVGFGLQRLFLDDCDIVEDDITKLATVVGKVEWTPQKVKYIAISSFS